MLSWQIGDVRVTQVVELTTASLGPHLLPQATPESMQSIPWMAPFIDEQGRIVLSGHALVIETAEQTIVVDTCIGNDNERSVPNWSHLQTHFLQDLEAAGYAPDTIDTVLCTHLHVDHVGWNTMLVDGQWVPTFPDARYLFARTEWEHWDANDDETVYGPVLADSVRPVVEAGLVDLVDMDHRVCPEVCLEPTPGHTPGHVSVHIRSGNAEALITGDCIHHPVQMTRPDWCSSADVDQAQGLQTRETLLQRYVDQDILIIGTHFATPTAGHIKHLEVGGYYLDVFG